MIGDLHDDRRPGPTTGDPRHFGLSAAGISILIGSIVLVRGGDPAWTGGFLVAGLLAAILALAAPGALIPVRSAWMKLARALGWFNTRVLLTLVFFLTITPIALLLRLAGKDPMDRRWREPGRDSYWKERPAGRRGDLRRPF